MTSTEILTELLRAVEEGRLAEAQKYLNDLAVGVAYGGTAGDATAAILALDEGATS